MASDAMRSKSYKIAHEFTLAAYLPMGGGAGAKANMHVVFELISGPLGNDKFGSFDRR